MTTSSRWFLAATLLGPAAAQGADPLFTDSTSLLPPARNAQAVLDLDHDGRLDVLSWVWSHVPGGGQPVPSLVVHGLCSNGEAQLAQRWSFVLPAASFASCDQVGNAVGDFDGDGHDDFAIANVDTVHVYATRAAAPPVLVDSFVVPASAGASLTDLRALDLDGDGRDDLAAINSLWSSGYLSRGGAAPFQPAGSALYGFFSSFTPRVAVVDVGMDGREEVAVRADDSAELWIFGCPTSSFSLLATIQTRMQFCLSLAGGDLDGDGDDDLVAFDRQGVQAPPTFEVYRQSAAGVLVIEAVQNGGPATHLADIDGDGDLDGVCCGGSGPCDWGNTAPTVFEICLNDGSGSFDASIRRANTATGADGLAGALDFDGDGDVDLVGGRGLLQNHLTVGATYCAPSPNSTGAIGALEFTGSASLGRGDLALRGSDLPPQATAIVLLGGRAASLPMGTSTLCLAPPHVRLAVARTDSTGAVTVALTPASFPAVYPGALAAGVTRRFQLWHRDVTPAGFGLSEGGRVTFAP